MKIIYDYSAVATAAELQKAWFLKSTFAVVPAKTEYSDKVLQGLLKLIPEDLCKDHFVLFTSGSTGRPKLVIGSKARAVKLAQVLTEVQNSGPVKQVFTVLPLSYSYGFVNQWVWATENKRELLFTEGFSNPGALQESLENAQDAMLCLVGAQVPLLNRYYGDSLRFTNIIRLHFAGGKFPQDSLDYLGTIFPNAEIYNNYGCVEAMPRLTIREASAADRSNNIGIPLPGIELDSDSAGKLRFKSPYGAVGYIENDAFCRINDNEWVYSGDFGHPLQDGNWVLEGRANEVFKRYGEKIALYAIEESVKKQWSGSSAFYRESDANGEAGYVLVVSPTLSKEQCRAILRQFRENFPRTHWPLRLESVEAFPLLPSGKVDMLGLSKIKDEKTIHWYQRI